MSGRFVRASKYRHVYGQPVKKELCYDNIRLTKNAWDSNLIKVNPKYLSVNWDASGGGAFAVIPLEQFGKLPDKIPLFRGHTAAVLDTDWNPFNDDIVASASDDGKIAIWKVPEDFAVKKLVDDDKGGKDEEIQDITEPLKKLSGHSKKVGHVQWHPTAENILASSSGDFTIKIWNVETGKCLYTLQHQDLITSFAFNYDGSKIASTSRDKQIRVWDIREEKIISKGAGHTGAKSSRVTWLGNTDRIATTGFSRLSDRQYAVWNVNDIESGPIGGFQFLDASAGICMPFYDEGNNILYLGGKGDGNIRYFEYSPEKDEFFPLSEYQSVEPQRGLAIMAKRGLAVKDHEVIRFYKTVNDTMVEPIQFFVPRRADTFQADIYPHARAGEAALSADEWISGKNANPKLIDLEAVFEGRDAKAFVAKEEEKTELKEEKKEEEKKEEVTKEEEKKEEAKEEKKEEAKEVKKEEKKPELVERRTLQPQSEEDLFASQDVKNFLAKSADTEESEDEQHEEEENDGWTELEKSEEQKPLADAELEQKPEEVPTRSENESVAASENGGRLEPEPTYNADDNDEEPVVGEVHDLEKTVLRLTQHVASLTVRVENLIEQVAEKSEIIDQLQQEMKELKKN